MAAIFQIRRGDSSYTSSLVNGELYLNTNEGALQVGTPTAEAPIKLLSLNTSSFGDIILTGSAYISGNVVLGGTITIGDSTSDSVIFNADLSSSIIPDSGSTYDLGSNSKWYKNLYVNTISASFISGSIAGVGDLQVFSASVDNRLDRVEASSSLYDNAMSGSKRLYVSPEGFDTNDGKDPSTPFKTIKAAVESLYPIEPLNLASSKRYTIFVGSGNYTEQNPIVVPPGVAIVGDTLRTVRLTAANPTKDFFHTHDSNYFYGLRFLDLKYPAFAFSFPSSTATGSISAGGISSIGVVHSMTGYTDGNNQDLGIVIEGPDTSGSIATATANVVGGIITQINVVNAGTNYANGEKPHISIPAPASQRPYITTSPYIQNCSSITGPFNTSGVKVLQLPPYSESAFNIDEQGAGGGIRIDGNLVDTTSPLESFVADAFTQVNQGGPGHLVINKGYAQFVSCFTTFCTYGFKTANGGFANVSNSVIDFGKYGLISKTYFPNSYNTATASVNLSSYLASIQLDENGAGYTGSFAGVTIYGGGASVQAIATASVDANGSIREIVITNSGSGYTSKPTVDIDIPTGAGAIPATTVFGKGEISNIGQIPVKVTDISRSIDISSNMVLNGQNYLVVDVSGSGQDRLVSILNTEFHPAPASITSGSILNFHQLSNISTGNIVMEYVGSGVTYNALPKFGGIPLRTREVNEFAPGRVFYTSVDNIGNLKIGDYFSVNQLTGEVSITSDSFNLTGLNAIGPFRRNGFDAGVILQEVSNNTNLLNSVGLYGEDTVPTQFAVKGYIDIRDAKLNKLEQTSGSLNTFSSSALIRLSNLETTSGSHNVRLNNLESTSASVKTSIAELNTYTSSLKTAITASGTDVTINGNLTVKGTTTQIDSTTLNIGDNIIELNYGGSQTLSGIYTKDATGALSSGSLLWNSTTDRWIAGVSGSESTILLAGGDNVISSSSQLGDLNAFTASVTSSLVSIYQTTASLNLFSASVTSSLVSIYQTTASLNTATASLYSSSSLMTASIASLTSSVVALQQFSGNVNTRFDAVQTYTTSVNSRFTTLGSYTASVNQTTASLNSFTESTNTRLGLLETSTGSLNQFSASVTSSLVSIYQTTASLNSFSASVTASLVSIYQTTASLNSFTTSTSQSLWYLYSSSTNHEERIDYIEGIGGISGGSPLGPLNIFSASINTFTSSINTTIKTKLDADGVISGAAQITITDLDGFADYNDSIMGDISGKEEVASGTHTLVSGSSQILGGTGIVSGSSQVLGNTGIVSGSSQIVPLLPVGVISGSSQILGGTGIVSGSSQITPLLPNGVVSGSAQVITANSITLGTHTTGNYVQTVAGDTAKGLTVAGSGLESADVTLTLAQSIKTDANPQFNSLGIGTAASTTTGEIRATGDITAYYSSDIRLKENIFPIRNALQKVNEISGNTYDWKEGFDEIHSHKGTDVGVIAQEIEIVLPQIVTSRDNGFKAVQYEKIIPLLIEAIKELSAKVDRLENK